MTEAKTPAPSNKVFRLGAILNWAATLPAIVSPTFGAYVLGLDLAEPFLLRIWAGIAFVWGWMFWTIAKDPVRGRWMMKYAIIEKMVTATAVTAAFYTPGSGVGWRCFGFVLITDHLWIPLFGLVWILTRKTTRQEPRRTEPNADWVRESPDRFGANWLRLAGLVSLGFAIWVFASDDFRNWLGSRPPTLPFLAQIWAGMAALLGIVLLEVAAGDPCRRRAMLRYCIAARGLIAISVVVGVFSGEIARPLAIVVLLADTMWIVPLFVIDAYWRGAPSVEWAYGDARRVLS